VLVRWLLAALHLLALAIGFGAIWVRGRSLLGPLDAAGLKRALAADTAWGAAALLWIATGAVRAFTGIDKGPAYYLHNTVFLAKMGLVLLILLLEAWPMGTLLRWRLSARRGDSVDTALAPAFARISFVQAGLVVAIVFAATAMARGLGSW
jgi:putative membrane protein